MAPKIVILANELVGGGVERLVLETCRCLQKTGYEVTVCAYPHIPVPDEVIREYSACGAQLRLLRPLRNTHPWTLCRILQTLIAEKPSVVVAYVGYQAALIAPLRWFYGSPRVVYQKHGFHSRWWSNLLLSLPWVRHNIDVVLCVSRAVKESFTQCLPAYAKKTIAFYAATVVPPLGEDDPGVLRDKLGLSGCRIIGNIARLSPEKGQIYLVDATPTILGRYPDVHLLLAGDGPLRSELMKRVTTLGVSANVHFLGWSDDVWPIYRSLDLYVQPSTQDALPVSLVEASFAGIPSVVTNVGGQPEVVVDRETGRVVPAEDATALADAICTMLADPTHMSKMGSNARKRAEDLFSSEALQGRYSVLLDSLLGDQDIISLDERVNRRDLR